MILEEEEERQPRNEPGSGCAIESILGLGDSAGCAARFSLAECEGWTPRMRNAVEDIARLDVRREVVEKVVTLASYCMSQNSFTFKRTRDLGPVLCLNTEAGRVVREMLALNHGWSATWYNRVCRAVELGLGETMLLGMAEAADEAVSSWSRYGSSAAREEDESNRDTDDDAEEAGAGGEGSGSARVRADGPNVEGTAILTESPKSGQSAVESGQREGDCDKRKAACACSGTHRGWCGSSLEESATVAAGSSAGNARVTRLLCGGTCPYNGALHKTIASDLLGRYYNYSTSMLNADPLRLAAVFLDEGTIALKPCSLAALVRAYPFFSIAEMGMIAGLHGISFCTRSKKSSMIELLEEHCCGPACVGVNSVFLFKTRDRRRYHVSSYTAPQGRKRKADEVGAASARRQKRKLSTRAFGAPVQSGEEYDYPRMLSREAIDDIIAAYQERTSVDFLSYTVCACCAEKVHQGEVVKIEVDKIDFKLLRRSPWFPEQFMPLHYKIDAYDGAMLDYRGLEYPEEKKGRVNACKSCTYSLLRAKKMPRLALSNWFYYAYDHVPAEVKAAWASATFVDKRLTARCSASRICHRFMESPSSVHYRDGQNGLQRYSTGNIVVLPQEQAKLHQVLPPPPSDVKDAFTVLFAGTTKPTRETLKTCKPVMASPKNVKTIIDFLLARNVAYSEVCPEFPNPASFSQENFAAHFGVDNGEDSERRILPASVQIGHIEMSEGQAGSSDDSSRRNEFVEGSHGEDGDFFMEACGFTRGEVTPENFRSMKASAMEHCLTGKTFLLSKKGETPVKDMINPNTLTWLFPHLDPFGLGGFLHPRRQQKVSMSEQLRHMLMLADSPFEKDPDFAFVFHNIIQKRQALRETTFRVNSDRRGHVLEGIRGVSSAVFGSMAARFKKNPMAQPESEEEKKVLRVLKKVSMVQRAIPGTSGYKQARRNEIRALVYKLGCPALYMTVTPTDIDSGLVRLLAGEDADPKSVLAGETVGSRFKRAKRVAENPAAAAKSFHETMQRLMDLVLRVNSTEDGLFGRCTGMYGAVEAQGRGTLHCHMLIWLKGHPSPEELREKLASDESWKKRMFDWLERHISCELPGSSEVVKEQGEPAPKPHLARNDIDPRTLPGPQIADFLKRKGSTGTGEDVSSPEGARDEFHRLYVEHVKALVEQNNWHTHSFTCWKHLKKGEKRGDATCRMRIDGTTRAETGIDEESGSILLRRLHPRINEYNPIIMFLLKCNMDIQFIGSGEEAKAALYYITDYITKASLPVHAGLTALSYAIEQNGKKFSIKPGSKEEEERSLLTKMVNAMVSRQETSHQQVMSYYVGGGDTYTTHKYRIMHWGSFDRFISSCEAEQNEVGQGNSDDSGYEGRDPDSQLTMNVHGNEVTFSSQRLDYIYRAAEAEFTNLCLYDFVSLVEKEVIPKVKAKGTTVGEIDREEVEGDDEQDESRLRLPRGRLMREHPECKTHRQKRFMAEYVPVILGPTLPRPDRTDVERAAWARAMLILFKPWREESDLKRPGQTWMEAYESYDFTEAHRAIMGNMTVLHQCKDARDNHMAKRRNRVVRDFEEVGGGDIDCFEDEMLADTMFEEALEPDADLERAFEGTAEFETKDQDLEDVLRCASLVESDLAAPVRRVGRDWESYEDLCVEEVSEEGRVRIESWRERMAGLRTRRPLDTDEIEEEASLHAAGKNAAPRMSLEKLSGKYAAGTATSLDAEGTPDVVRELIKASGMDTNFDQARALTIIGEHVMSGSEEQLIMYVGGVGGTGKSHVIKKVVSLFETLNRRCELLLGAPTGAAAVLIEGHTIHALTMLPSGKAKYNKERLEKLWRDVRYLIIDEVSMISSTFLSQICSRISDAKGSEPAVPFGGVNVIFSGDLGQLKPIDGKCMFDPDLVKEVGIMTAQDATGQASLHGAFLWRQVNNVVMLRKNVRQDSDKDWAALLGRVRVGNARSDPSASRQGEGSTSPCKSDYEELAKREISNVAVSDRASLSAFVDAPVIVTRRALRDQFNSVLSRKHAARLGEQLHWYYSKDKRAKAELDYEVQERAWKLKSTITKDSLGALPLFPGMKVMVTENIAISKSVVNGAEGTVAGIHYECDASGRRYPLVVFVHIPGCKLEDPWLPPEIVPITPSKTYFKYRSPLGKEYSITRSQVPLVPAYSYTDYKSQGRSLDRAIVDLAGCRTLQSLYVMLSRVKELKGVLILRWFPPNILYRRLPSFFRSELARLDALDLQCRADYLQSHNHMDTTED